MMHCLAVSSQAEASVVRTALQTMQTPTGHALLGVGTWLEALLEGDERTLRSRLRKPVCGAASHT